MADASLTRLACTTGTRDQTTGYLALNYAAETTITGMLLAQGETVTDYKSGATYRSTYPHTAFIPDVIHEDDKIKNANGDYFMFQPHTKEGWLF